MVYRYKTFSFEELSELDGSTSIHIRNLEVLATEMFKTNENKAPPISSSLSEPHNIQRVSCEMLQIFQFYMLQLFLSGQKVFRFWVQKCEI